MTELTQPALSPENAAIIQLTRKDFVSDQEVRWCPGCGDYSILAQTQKQMPDFGVPKENIVFISGIGCSSRFPYYMHTYGFHTIHGRAPTLATGPKAARPRLIAWVVTALGAPVSTGGTRALPSTRRARHCGRQPAVCGARGGPRGWVPVRETCGLGRGRWTPAGGSGD